MYFALGVLVRLATCRSCSIMRRTIVTSLHQQQQRNVMNVFNRQMKRMQRNRTSRLENPEVYDYIRKETAYLLYDRINDIKRHFPVVVDLGCHRGYLSQHLTKDTCDVIYQCEMAQDLLLYKSNVPPDLMAHKVICDEEFFPFAENSIDMVASNLVLHWVNDLPSTFKQIFNALKPDGVFIASILGGETLYELRTSLQLAELEREGGFGPHISPMTDARDLGDLLTRAGFTLLTVDVDEMIVSYPGPFQLLSDLQGMGETNCSWDRKPFLYRETLVAAEAIYRDLYGNEDGTVPATFQFFFLIGWKPHPSQAKPAKRGSGQISMKDLDKIDELIEKSHTQT